MTAGVLRSGRRSEKVALNEASRIGDVVVVGGSLAGLLAAAAVAPYAERVRVLDRDDLVSELVAPRRGTPQAGHSHALLMGGMAAFDELVPGFSQDVVERGGILSDVLGRTLWLVDDRQQARAASSALWLISSRTLIESCVRRRVGSLVNVTLEGGVDIVDLASSDDFSRVTGAIVTERDGPLTQRIVPADLVIDASGKKPRSLAWLKAHGYSVPGETVVPAGIRYVTRRFEQVPGVLDDVDGVTIPPYTGSRRAGLALRQEGGVWSVTLGGRFGEEPPLELDAFRAFARSLPTSALAELTEGCTPIGEPLKAAFPVSRLRHWDQLQRRPRGLVVIGDAVAAVNPTVGQGMTMTAQQAVALRTTLREHGVENIESRAATALAEAVTTAWEIGTIDDLMASTPDAASRVDRLLDRFLGRAIAVGTQRVDVALALMRVFHLLDTSAALLNPRILWAVYGPESRKNVKAAALEQHRRHAGATGVAVAPAAS
jgi:2-polyprenyl-6-methoxyphenol hydroxylase-like FAD-dependent oxidoreductase